MHRDGDVREDRADDEIHLVALDEALRLRDGDVGLELVVHDDQLHVAPAELASQILDGKLKSVSRLLAEDGRGAGQGQQQPDPQLVLRLGLEAAAECGGKREDKGGLLHRVFSLIVEFVRDLRELRH